MAFSEAFLCPQWVTLCAERVLECLCCFEVGSYINNRLHVKSFTRIESCAKENSSLTDISAVNLIAGRCLFFVQ